MDSLIKVFGALQLSTVIAVIAAIAFLVTIGIKIYKFIVKQHDARQEREDTLKEIKQGLADIKAENLATQETIREMKEVQSVILERQQEAETRRKEHDLNKLRDRLLQSYRYYADESKNPMKAWTELEKETFDKLFKDYEELGGNGYMHSEVLPAMLNLTVINVSELDKLYELQKTRRG